MRIGQLADLTGVSVRSLRYYEQQGLLPSDRGTGGRGHRRFENDAATTVGHIRVLLAAGIPTRLIYQLLPCTRGPHAQLEQCAAPMLREHLRHVDEQLTALRTARTRLIDVLDRAHSVV